MKMTSTLVAVATATAIGLTSCGKQGGTASGERAANALASYVAPGEKDEYYLFYSGGHSGQVYVAGIPSLRHISTIPVFAPYPATGYGFDDESRKMLGDFTWGDVHHPALSQTNSKYDGRWLFVNDNANNRIARIDLRDFKTHQILGPIPNSIGNHGSSFITENSEYILCATRFSVPLPKGRVADPNDYEKEFNGMVSGIKVDPQTGEMKVGLANSDAAVRLGSRLDRQRTIERLGVLDELQHGDGARHAGGELDAKRSRSRDGSELARSGESCRRRESADDGWRADHRSSESSGRFVFRADRQIAARHGCRSNR